MSDTREWVVQWLRDAHAMEQQAETMLSGLLGRLDNYPELSQRISSHLEETKQQAERLHRCLENIDEETSTMKDVGGKLIATGQSISGFFAGDEVMKGALAGYTFEQMEIASYTALIAAAESIGETEIAGVCRQNLQEEITMAEWLKENLPSVTTTFLSRDARGDDTAKR